MFLFSFWLNVKGRTTFIVGPHLLYDSNVSHGIFIQTACKKSQNLRLISSQSQDLRLKLSKPQLNHDSIQPNITLSWVGHENDFAYHPPTETQC